jgi:hypothetical protein
MYCRFGTFGLICKQPVQHSAMNYIGVLLAMIRYFASGPNMEVLLYHFELHSIKYVYTACFLFVEKLAC